MGDGFQDHELSFEQLYEQAGASQPALRSFGQDFLGYLKDKYPEQFDGVQFELAPIKDRTRALDKIQTDYGGDHTKIVDLVRGRFLVDTPQQIEIIRTEMSSMRDEMGIVKIKDFYAEPMDSHFRALNTQVRLENGHVAEFRIDQHDMAIASHNSHKIYEEKQEIERRVISENRPYTDQEAQRRSEIIQEQRAEFDRAANKAGLDTLLNEKRVAMLESHRIGKMQSLAETFGHLGKNSGFVAGLGFGGLTSAFTLAAGGTKAEAAEALYESAMPYGETQLDLVKGDLAATERSATIETFSNLGAGGGMIVGGLVGQRFGGGRGAAIGAAAGGIAGGIASGELTAFVHDDAPGIYDFFDKGDDRLLARLPTKIDENVPPELLHLVEIKRMLVETHEELALLDRGCITDGTHYTDRRELNDRLERIEQMYDEAYDTYEQNGTLAQAVTSLGAWEQAGQIAQKAIETEPPRKSRRLWFVSHGVLADSVSC